MAILTLTEYKKYKPDLATGADTRLQKIIDAAEAYFLMRIKRNIEEVEHEEYYDGDSTGELILNNYPVTSVTELKVLLNEVMELIDSNDYIIYNSSGLIKLKNGAIFYTESQNVYVKYKSGYTDGNIPKEIEMAIAEIVTKKYEQFDKKGESFSSEAFIGGSLVFKESDLTDFARDVINNYRKKGRRN